VQRGASTLVPFSTAQKMTALETTLSHPLWSWVWWFFSKCCLISAAVPPQSWQSVNVVGHRLQRFSDYGTCPTAMWHTCVLPSLP